jgi:hypothetical protein
VPHTSSICPAFCANPHREQPGDLVHHHTSPIVIPAADGGPDLPVVAGYHEHDGAPRLDVGPYQLDLTGARQLLAELRVKVAFMERLDVDAHLDRLLEQHQVA